MEWIPGERRKRGRPRKTWMEGVRAAMKTRHLEADKWLNRKEWCLGYFIFYRYFTGVVFK
jgi:hypothetical protein